MANPTSPYVFISYSHDDCDFAAGLSTRLRRAAIPHFRDTEAIAWGDYIPDRIHDALTRATHLVVLISPGSEQSQWVSYEMGFARGKDIVLVPYLLHPKMKLPGFLSNIRYLASEADEAEFITSLKSLKKAKRKPTASSGSSENDKRQSIKAGLAQIRSQHPGVRQDGIDLLVELKAIDHLMPLLGHRDRTVRGASAEALARLHHPDAIEYLVGGLGFTGSRSRSPIIPNVEDLFVYYGDAALPVLLERIPDSLGYYDGPERWTHALTNAASRKGASVLLERAIHTGRKEFFTAAIRTGAKFKKDDLLKGIDAHTPKAYDRKSAQRYIAGLLAESATASAQWARRLVKKWLLAQIQEFPPTKMYGSHAIASFGRTALTMGAVTPTEVRDVATSNKNSQLRAELLEELENWPDDSGT